MRVVEPDGEEGATPRECGAHVIVSRRNSFLTALSAPYMYQVQQYHVTLYQFYCPLYVGSCLLVVI